MSYIFDVMIIWSGTAEKDALIEINVFELN
jgi:hypothetical protein